jgi:hypothetical protein
MNNLNDVMYLEIESETTRVFSSEIWFARFRIGWEEEKNEEKRRIKYFLFLCELNGYDVATSDIVTNNLTVVMTRRLSSLWLHSFLAACFRFISSLAKLDFSSLFFLNSRIFLFWSCLILRQNYLFVIHWFFNFFIVSVRSLFIY